MEEKMEVDRAIEILSPEHREHYDTIEPVNEACRMGMEALEFRKPKKPYDCGATTCYPVCPTCNKSVFMTKYCGNCGQAIDWSEWCY